MRHFSFLLFLLCCQAWTGNAQSTQLSPLLTEKAAPEIKAQLLAGEQADLLVVFREQADIRAAANLHGKTAKAAFVLAQLQQTAERTQGAARRLLRNQNAYFNTFYVVNALAVRQADAALAEALARLPEVAYLAPDPVVALPAPEVEQQTTVQRGGVEWGVERVMAPAVWALGYTGQSITVGGADTGYDWVHPALQPHYRGYNVVTGAVDHNYNWHDAIHAISPLSGDTTLNPANNPCGVNSPFPCDDHNHGTHTMGTMVGDDGAGNQIGVAPGAQWVACRNMERGNGQPSSYLECFEWFLAPTDQNGQNPDPAKAPHVINNSWYCATWEGCTDLAVNELLRQAVINLRASGVFVVVSNGNTGSNCGTTTGPPAYFEESFSVGAARSNDTIAGFSSRGPVWTDGSFRVKPNIVAPGTNIRSSIRNGGYTSLGGTSMAGPHVAGVVALVLSARPDLAGEVELLEDILEETARPAFDTLDCSDAGGTAYPNNTYGFGHVNALAAVLKALSLTTSSPGLPQQTPSVHIYPNPVREKALFDLQYWSGEMTLALYNAAGQQVVSLRQWIGPDRTQLQVPTKELAPGVYFWKVQTPGQLLSGKMIKQ